MSNEITYRKNSITDADIVTGNCFLSHAMTGETLASDTLDFRVWSDTGLGRVDADFIDSDGKTILTSDGKIFRSMIDEDYTEFVPGSSLEYKRDGKLVSKFFLRDVKRAGKYMYDFSCVSAIGVLGDTMHYGGIYTGQTVATVAGEILDGLPYEIEPIVGDIKLYGWLPFDTKRNNLQQITMATAIAVRTKPDGSLLLTALSNDIKGIIGADRMSIGGNVAVDTPYSAVQVSEHYYQALDDEIVLFSESSVKTEFLKFNEPVHDIVVTGGTIHESGANYAIVECNGFTEVKAKKYLHTTRTVTVGTVVGLPSDKIYSVNNATLITSLNSSGVAQKLYEAYTKPTTIQSNIFFGNEKAGDVVNVLNPHTEKTESAFLKKQDINISNLLLANSDFIVDFTPSGAVTGYKNRVLITEGASWTKPAGVTDYRAVLIGAGDGGQAGFNGQSGQKGYQYTGSGTNNYGDGGDGGLAGVAGTPGKIFDTGSITTTSNEQVISLSIGGAGTGGSSNGAIGAAGGETTFKEFSSADGQVKETGYVDILQGDIFALPGTAGVKGGDGEGPRYEDLAENVYGPDETPYYAGKAGDYDSEGNYLNSRIGVGGGGGGAAVGDHPDPLDTSKNGSDGYLSGMTPYGGTGGRGGNADAGTDATIYGSPGNGGHGGGGGGGGGSTLRGTENPGYQSPGNGGPGGAGGKGGDGKQGCIIIYY